MDTHLPGVQVRISEAQDVEGSFLISASSRGRVSYRRDLCVRFLEYEVVGMWFPGSYCWDGI